MTCFLQFEDGSGVLKLEDNGNLLLELCVDDVVLLGGTPAGPNVNPNAPGFFYELPYTTYQREQAAIAEKQSAVISLRLEAQDNLVRQRELKEHVDKQSIRQLGALEREQTQLLLDIKQAMVELAAQQLQNNNNLAIALLITAYPYLNIGGSMH